MFLFSARLAALDEVDEKRKRHEGALNALESFILDTRMRLETSEFIAAGSEAERETLSSALSAAADWLDEEGAGAETSEFEKRLKDLQTGASPMLHRVEEHRNRPEALAALEKIIETSKKFLKLAENKSADSEEKVFTEVEVASLSKLIKETRVIYSSISTQLY